MSYKDFIDALAKMLALEAEGIRATLRHEPGSWILDIPEKCSERTNKEIQMLTPGGIVYGLKFRH